MPIQDLEKLLSVERGRVERLEGRLLVSTWFEVSTKFRSPRKLIDGCHEHIVRRRLFQFPRRSNSCSDL